MNIKYFLIFILLLSNTFSLFTQELIHVDMEKFKTKANGFQEAKKNVEQGENYYLQGVTYSWVKAVEVFTKAYSYNPGNAALNYLLGISCLLSQQNKKALPYLYKAYQLDAKVAPDIVYALGRAYQVNNRFSKAENFYNQYRKAMQKANNDEQVTKAKKRIQECEIGLELMKNAQKVLIDNLGPNINTNFNEMAPVISADESLLIFSSDRQTRVNPDEDTPNSDIYMSEFKKGAWTKAVKASANLNTPADDSPAGLSPDGQLLYIYKGKNGGDIYESHLKGTNWEKPKSVGSIINSPFNENSASVSYDGNTIYFSSDNKTNNLGGFDIFVIHKMADGTWSTPENLGPPINTVDDEMGVFIMPDDRTLYFSSNGHKSMGNYDIFRSYLQDNHKWSKPENIGYPINTPLDDVLFVVSASGKHAYYASSREDSYGLSDIYRITFLNPLRQSPQSNDDNLIACMINPVTETIVDTSITVKVIHLTIVKGIITDATTKQPIEASIDIVDNEKNRVIFTTSSNSSTGKYLVSLPSGKNYAIAVKKEGYMPHSENFNLPLATSYQEFVKDIELNDISINAKTILKNLFFDTGSSTLRPESTPELERMISFLKEYATVRVEISGHTDNVGTEAYNQKLSEDRAQAVVDYMTKHGIDASKVVAKGYNFAQPVADNDTEEGRQQNRRVEFKIISK